MTTYNTGNGIGSADPRDLYDNAQVIDEYANSESDEFEDRLGKRRLTIQGMVEAATTGNPAVGAAQEALGSAQRSEEQADRAEEQADRAEQEVAAGINLGVSQATSFATQEADRAEAARDAAFINADVYSDVVSGLSDTSNGEQFQVVEGAEVVRYLNDDGAAVEVARYPASEFVRIVLDVASRPGPVSGEFYGDASDSAPIYSIIDKSGNQVLSILESGEIFVFGKEQFPSISGEFHTEPGDISFALTDPDGRIFLAFDDQGAPVQGGGGLDLAFMPTTSSSAGNDEPYRYYKDIKVSPGGDSFIESDVNSPGPHQDFYELFDVLESEFPDYISSEVLGTDALDNEIRMYRASPPEQWKNGSTLPVSEKPKIILFGCVHGNEKRAALANYQLISEMCRRWRDDERLARLRWGLDLIVVPVVNPSGFDVRERHNHNGVDINRNFPHLWDENTSPVKGDSPASEAETQVVLDLVNLHPDAILVDHHNAGSLNDPETPYAFWMGTEDQRLQETARSNCDHMMKWIRKEYDYIDQNNTVITRLTGNPVGTLAHHFNTATDIPALLLENGSGFDSWQDLQKHQYEAIIHTMVSLMEFIEKKRNIDAFKNYEVAE